MYSNTKHQTIQDFLHNIHFYFASHAQQKTNIFLNGEVVKLIKNDNFIQILQKPIIYLLGYLRKKSKQKFDK